MPTYNTIRVGSAVDPETHAEELHDMSLSDDAMVQAVGNIMKGSFEHLDNKLAHELKSNGMGAALNGLVNLTVNLAINLSRRRTKGDVVDFYVDIIALQTALSESLKQAAIECSAESHFKPTIPQPERLKDAEELFNAVEEALKEKFFTPPTQGGE